VDLQIDTMQHRYIQAAFGEALGDATGFKHHLIFQAILASST
jgi:hypothetical protein